VAKIATEEVERRLGKSSLLEAVSDGLILWALEGTDPDKKIFLTRDASLAKIEESVPPARRFIRGTVNTGAACIETESLWQGGEMA
jgi:hypothetical protein